MSRGHPSQQLFPLGLRGGGRGVQSILEMDFLAAHDLLVDLHCRCLLHQPLATIIHAEPCAQMTSLLTTLCQAKQFEALLQ
ncbi:hypothetical protein E2C01_068707 [Portunus trituberculatus]|uniref:Uncharacterized protein n=1 Tax=Portunus trituberculatus TaxID=210409 RepID=A0A5B7HPI3_PORTR|nr:hypothetical protein [Portunus trituberculatus]